MATIRDLGRQRRIALRRIQRATAETSRHASALGSYLRVQLKRGERFIPTDENLMTIMNRYQQAVTASRELSRAIDGAADLFG